MSQYEFSQSFHKAYYETNGYHEQLKLVKQLLESGLKATIDGVYDNTDFRESLKQACEKTETHLNTFLHPDDKIIIEKMQKVIDKNGQAGIVMSGDYLLIKDELKSITFLCESYCQFREGHYFSIMLGDDEQKVYTDYSGISGEVIYFNGLQQLELVDEKICGRFWMPHRGNFGHHCSVDVMLKVNVWKIV